MKHTGTTAGGALDRRWYVVQTRPGCEGKATEKLQAAGYSTYAPVMRKDIVHHRTKKVVTKTFPLFNRYLFVEMPAAGADWYNLRACDGVDCVLGSGGAPVPVDAETVESFRAAELDMAFDDTREAKIHRGELRATRRAELEARYPKGAEIRVRLGDAVPHPFGGFFGHVVSVAGSGKVKAMMQLFGKLVPVDIKADDVDVVQSTGRFAA